VLGTDDSVAYVERAGGVVVARDDEGAGVVVVADDDGYPFLGGIEEVITTLFHKLDRDEPVELLLPNPDLIYPKDARSSGLGSGSVALVIERALSVRYPARRLAFVGLGKPHRPIFDAALRRTGAPDRRRVVVLGDQLPTDIRGAHDAGLDSVLLGTGLTRLDADLERADVRPTWLLPSLGG
jgi:ribonucleotide monophosphatase NagD (HAD superfamily)